MNKDNRVHRNKYNSDRVDHLKPLQFCIQYANKNYIDINKYPRIILKIFYIPTREKTVHIKFYIQNSWMKIDERMIKGKIESTDL